MAAKIVRVMAHSSLVLNPEEKEMVDKKEGRLKVEEIYSKMTEEIALKSFRMHESLNITGMMYFNIMSGELMQVLEGKPQDLAEALKHVVRDVRQNRLCFQIESERVTRRYKGWGMISAGTAEEWSIVRLIVPDESEWDRIKYRSEVEENSNVTIASTPPHASLVDAIEAKRPILDRFGPDCKRIWRRRKAIATPILSVQEKRYFRERYELTRKAFQARSKAGKTVGLLSCIDNPEEIKFPDKYPKELDISAERKSSRHSEQSNSKSRISVSRSGIIERLREEEAGFVETIEDIADFHEMSKQEAPKKRYSKRNKKRKKSSATDQKRVSGQAGSTNVAKEWRFIQAIGPDEGTVASSPNQDDFVTSLKLDPSGTCIAIGDSQGRIGIFNSAPALSLPKDPFQFYEEFVSHNADFDTLYSRRIPRNVIALEWLERYSQNMHLLASNEKTIKLWRLKEMQTDQGETQICPVLARSFEKGHQRFFIHSISAFSDGETFLSSDELALNVWHLERGDSCYQLNDTADMTTDTVEINRIITSAKACPLYCYRFFYATSLSEVNICDLRTRCRHEKPAQTLMCSVDVKGVSEEVIRELECITDADFSECGNYIVAKQFTCVQIWDLRKASAPIKKISTCDTDPSLFDEMCTSGCLVDDFRVVCNQDASGFITGTYDNFFIIYDCNTDQKIYLQARHQYDQKNLTQPEMEEYTKKVLHVDWYIPTICT
ncbi:hypothetical protein AAMO2058_001002700 [Amorphochlora amoebiformis]